MMLVNKQVQFKREQAEYLANSLSSTSVREVWNMRSKISLTNCSQSSALYTAIYILVLSPAIWSWQF